MKEKLLALLVAKFSGVSKATLERIAEKKAGSVTDESQLQSVADGIDFGQIVQSEVDSKITEANKKAIQNYETAHKLKDGKPVENPNPPAPPAGGDDDIKAIIANAIKEAVTPLQQKLEGYEAKETRAALMGKVKTSLSEKKIPESFWSKRGITVESEEQLPQVISEIESDYTAFKQEMVNQGVMIDKPASSEKFDGGVDDFISSMKDINAAEK